MRPGPDPDPGCRQEAEEEAEGRQQAPGVQRGPHAGVGEVGIRDPRAQEEESDLAGHVLDARNGGTRARRGSIEHQRRLRHSQLPQTGRVPAPTRFQIPARRPSRSCQSRFDGNLRQPITLNISLVIFIIAVVVVVVANVNTNVVVVVTIGGTE